MSEKSSSPIAPRSPIEVNDDKNNDASETRESVVDTTNQQETSQAPGHDYDDNNRYDDRRRSYSPRSRSHSYSRHRSYSRSRSRSYSRSRSPPSYYERSRHHHHRSSHRLPPPYPPLSHHRHHRHHPYHDTYYGRSSGRYPLSDHHHHRSYSSRRSRSPPIHRYRSRSPSRSSVRPPPYRSNPDCRVYVGNLPYEARWTDLKDFMRKEAGPVVHADIMKSGSNRSLGCGTVEFEYPEDAQRAIRMLNDVEFMGRVIFLREDRPHDSRKDGFAPDECRLFVDNLPLTASWQDMKDLFRKTGRVLHTDVTTDPITRRPNGSGLVIFDDPRDARSAIELFNGYEWQGHRLRVMEEREAANHLAPLPPQSTAPTSGLSITMSNSRVPPPPPPPETNTTPIQSGTTTPSQQQPANTSVIVDMDTRDMENTRPVVENTADGYIDSYYGGSSYYGEGYYDERYSNQQPPPPPPPPPAASSLSSISTAVGTSGMVPPPPPPSAHFFPSLVSGPGASLPSHGANQIFVNKLPYATTSQDLIDLFRHVGPVVRSEILWYNGRPKGSGLVRFEDRITCERAIGKFNGYLYGGRKLDIRMDKYSPSA
ncbi:uncharacterized protein BX664DRAFT_292492 [Halteromyces radiatus]|uniref:uncharacterized protein n=1 Tax=Halteromyces radiatus TaxID=101107 RepID=UPI00221F42B1|nr:uncharacterized protein BX664DRAFT_292492 [Halteromyces radiatus]KAI8097138.1 hypothetical protein BX664DRAFT_292492 [Halteromyces radiatus]